MTNIIPESEKGNISAWSIRHPVQIIVLFLLLIIAGLASYPFLRLNNTPDLDLPSVTITVQEPGASPSEMETQITRRVEDSVAGLGDIKHITSTVQDGVSTTIIEFALGKNIDRAVSDVRDKIATIRSNLPGDILEPTITRVDASGGAIQTYVVIIDNMSPVETSWYIDNTIAKALLSIKGVSKVNRVGGADREIRVSLIPERLDALGITALDVNTQLIGINLNRPGGRSTLGSGEQTIRTLGASQSVDELKNHKIALPGGRTVRLLDIADVSDSTGEIRTQALFDGKPVVAFEILRTQASSEESVSRLVGQKIIEITKENPDVHISLVASTTVFVLDSFKGAIEALGIGAVLATLVVFLFLRNWRATLIVALAMPLSLIPSFASMLWFGFSLNNITLLGITLVIGVLVDDAIVEVENIERHLAKPNMTPRKAAFEASAEIGLAVLATTATILAVFVPVAFMPGIPGQFFRQFGLTVAGSVAFSLVVARMLTPLMSVWLLKAPKVNEYLLPRTIPPVKPNSGIMNLYLSFLKICLRHRFVTLIAGLLFFVGSVALVQLIPTDFVTASDHDRSSLSIELPPGSSLEQTRKVAIKITDILKSKPEVVSVFASLGTQLSGSEGGPPIGSSTGAGDPRSATLTINLVPKNKRNLSQTKWENLVRPELETAGVRIHFGADGQSGGRATVTFVGDDSDLLIETSNTLETQMRATKELSSAQSKASLSRPEVLIIPNPDRATELGVLVSTIGNLANIATIGGIEAQLAKFNLADRQIPIRVMLDEKARNDIRSLENLRVQSVSGLSVPLKAVADIRLSSGPQQIDRLDRSRKVSVQAELNGLPLGEASKIIYNLPIMKNLPVGVKELKTGDQEVMVELFTGFAISLGTGILLVYMVLVILFGGFLQPLTIMTALPLSLGGALLALLLTHSALGVSSVIGVLMLMGIVAKNSILIVEYIIESRASGMPRLEAILEAVHKRSRPVIMTTIAMTAGMIHIALGLGADAEFRSPMAIVVIGGLITSTVLSLVFVPVVYSLMDSLSLLFKRKP